MTHPYCRYTDRDKVLAKETTGKNFEIIFFLEEAPSHLLHGYLGTWVVMVPLTPPPPLQTSEHSYTALQVVAISRTDNNVLITF
jgi:hypothetical protein